MVVPAGEYTAGSQGCCESHVTDAGRGPFTLDLRGSDHLHMGKEILCVPEGYRDAKEVLAGSYAGGSRCFCQWLYAGRW